MPGWAVTILAYIGKALSALFAGAVAGLGSIIAVLVQIGEGAAFADIELVAWLVAGLAALTAFGAVLGINARQNNG
jgi:hypothetical protein